MIRKCYAKINLSLDILSRKDNGYHMIDSIMTRINLYDTLEIEKTDDKKFHYESNIDLGDYKDNLIYKAYEILSENVEDKGIRVKLTKEIPIAAGLAGGSTDCAETIKALNTLWHLSLSNSQMAEIGSRLGADIPFFFLEKNARARGVGEQLTPFDNNLKMYILLINDGTEISSKYVYNRTKLFGHVDNEKIINGLKNANRAIVTEFENVMEEVVLRDFSHLNDILYKLEQLGSAKSMVSGSGASIFGIFFDQAKLDRAYNKLKDSYKFVRKVELLDD